MDELDVQLARLDRQILIFKRTVEERNCLLAACRSVRTAMVESSPILMTAALIQIEAALKKVEDARD